MLLKMENISKSFPGVQALSNVDFELEEGEIHGLVGENGAGKSTLIKILSGVQPVDEGEIFICGEKVEIRDPAHARKLQIRTIFQEFTLIPCLSVMENVTLGLPPLSHPRLELVDFKTMRAETQAVINMLGVDIDPDIKVEKLGVAERQMIEIAKALYGKARILIMDEPTSALCPQETSQLHAAITALSKEGVGIIYISHRLEEVMEVVDRVTVLRDGRVVITTPREGLTVDKLIQSILGRKLEEMYPKVKSIPEEEALRVEGLTLSGKFEDISFTLKHGEILGIAGLVGAGRTDLAKTIFGEYRADQGRIWIEGKEVNILKPSQAIGLGVGYLPEDRKVDGLVLKLGVKQNLSLATLDRLARFGWLNLRVERKLAREYIENLGIATPDINRQVMYLSGGNQQKVVVGKWLSSKAQIVIFDEPTRGIDVGAKIEIYNLMNDLVQQGSAIIMISSENPELLGMADRILVMRKGRIVSEHLPEELSEDLLLSLCFGNN